MLANAGTAEGQGGRRPSVAARKLSLIGNPAMFDAIWKTRVRLFAAEMEIRFTGMTDRPFADLFVEIEQARLVGNVGAWLGWYEATWRRRRNRSCCGCFVRS